MKYNANLPLQRHPFLWWRSETELPQKRYSGKREKAPKKIFDLIKKLIKVLL